MIIDFTTFHIDKKLYQKAILHYIYDHYNVKDYPKLLEQDKWKITLQTLGDFKGNFYDENIKNLNYGIPHGVTGDNIVKCYVSDVTNPMFFMQNMMVICHELAHMILKIYYPKKRGILNHDDVWGRKGSERNFFSTEVHNRVYEKRVRKFFVLHEGQKMDFYGVDIEDLTNKRNLSRGF